MTTDVDLRPVSEMEESMYADISSKLLELCDAFTSELARLNRGNMLLKLAFSDPEDVSLSHLDCWRQHMASKNPKIENSGENMIMTTFLSKRFVVIKDVVAVESGVEMVYAVVQEGSVPNSLMFEPLIQSVMELSERLDLVSKETSCLFNTVIAARDELFERLRTKYEDELAESN
ncbi:Uncharacterized protein Rs2_41731 [Raphanus sativus]|nr:Uncharacterized protein Rs2_41731 [Raphanus sativus]